MNIDTLEQTDLIETEEPTCYVVNDPLMGGAWATPVTLDEIKEYVNNNLAQKVWVEVWDGVYLFSTTPRHGWLVYKRWSEVTEGVWDNVYLYRHKVGNVFDATQAIQTDLSCYDIFLEGDEETSDEAYLGEATLAKIRRHKELLLEDRDKQQNEEFGFEVVYGGYTNSAGGLEFPRVVVFSSREEFEKENPDYQRLLADARHRQCQPFVNMGDIYVYDRPEGGYEIYPRRGQVRQDGSYAEIW